MSVAELAAPSIVAHSMATLRTRRLAWIGIPIVLIVLIVALWNWDWFIPLVQARASAALGRPVTIEHLHVRVGRTVEITADSVAVANPPDWSTDDPPFVAIRTLTVQADAWGYIRGNGLVLPLIGIDGPSVLVAETTEGAANFRLPSGGSGTSMKIGDIRIADGNAHIVIPKLKANFNTRIETRGDGDTAKVLVEAKGTYAAQPITGRLVGGALLSLRDTQHPWPVELNVANGPTRVTLDGTIRDPLAFQGADLKLEFSGPDMELLEHLVGFPIPQTPAYQLAGKLDLEGFSKIRFRDFRGRLGNSDIEGTIEEQPGDTEKNRQAKPVVTLNLRSNRVDLVDLNGFIGGTPGRP
ncbi:MAG TPA: AsmA family protein, partial [Rhodopila sp.]